MEILTDGATLPAGRRQSGTRSPTAHGPRYSSATPSLIAMKLKRLDAIEFDRLAALTQLGPQARTMARMVLVEGRPMTRVGALHNTSRQRVSHAVEAIRRVHQRQAIDRGWMSVDEPLPEALSLAVADFARAFRVAPAGAARERALAQVVEATAQATSSLRAL